MRLIRKYSSPYFSKKKRQKNKCCRFLIWAPNNSWISNKNHQINLHGTWESPCWISPHLDPFQSWGGPGLAPQDEKIFQRLERWGVNTWVHQMGKVPSLKTNSNFTSENGWLGEMMIHVLFRRFRLFSGAWIVLLWLVSGRVIGSFLWSEPKLHLHELHCEPMFRT